MEDERLVVYNLIRKFIGKSNLTKVLISYNPVLFEVDDLLHDFWIKYYDLKYDKKYDKRKGLSLSSFIFKFVRWCLMTGIRDEVKRNVCEEINFDYHPSEEKSPEEHLIDKEIMEVLERYNYGGNHNKQYTEGVSQQDIATSEGVTRQAINQRIKIERKKLEKKLKKYL